MAKDKIFCGNGKLKKFANGGKLINAFLNVDVLSAAFKEYGFVSNRDERTMRIKICPVKDKPGDYYLEVDTWKPDNPADSNPTPHPRQQPQPQGQGQPGAVPNYPPPPQQPPTQDQINNAMAYDYDMPPHPEANNDMPPPRETGHQPQAPMGQPPMQGPIPDDDIPF